MVLSLASEDDKFLNPRSAHQMMPDLIELRAVFAEPLGQRRPRPRGRLVGVLNPSTLRSANGR